MKLIKNLLVNRFLFLYISLSFYLYSQELLNLLLVIAFLVYAWIMGKGNDKVENSIKTIIDVANEQTKEINQLKTDISKLRMRG